MFVGQKLEIIKNILIEQKSVTTSALCGLLDVSDVTVRKYLDTLEKEGFLIKVHGGAMIANTKVGTNSEPNYDSHKQIASLSITLLKENETIFIGDGLLCTEFARQLPIEYNISVITNNIDAVSPLSYSATNLFLLGGEIQRTENNIFSVGPTVIELLKEKYISKAFISPFGICLDAGITTNDIFLLELIRHIMKISREIIIMTKESTFNNIGMYHIAPIENFRTFVTNSNIPDNYREFFFTHNIKLLTSFEEQ